MVTEVKSVFGCAENYEVQERNACDFLFYFIITIFILCFMRKEFSSSNIPAACEMGAYGCCAQPGIQSRS